MDMCKMPMISDKEPLFKVALISILAYSGLGKGKTKEAEKSSECILTLAVIRYLLKSINHAIVEERSRTN